MAFRSGGLPTILMTGTLFAITAAPAAGAPGFAECVAGLQSRALDQGISQTVVDEVLARVSHIDRVIELDRAQPEFTATFADYFNRRVTRQRIEQGRSLIAKHRGLFERVQRETGVPAHVLVAFWGMETNFGRNFGNMPVPDSLATLACDQRRSDYFTSELIDALRIIDAGDISAERMQGSWAGAMGHVQFMPSVFLRFAVDGDGDGRRDLWNSIPDAMASAGNFLRGIGWKAEQRWGREVLLPGDFPYELAGRGQRLPLPEWQRLGVRTAFGEDLPAEDIEAALLVPAGHAGPAFLVYDNFNVIMRWNRSEFFALSVGHLADRIAGAPPLRRAPPDDAPRLSRADVKQIQRDLNRLGFDAGPSDGILGPATRHALSRFQRSADMVADGHPDRKVIEALRIAAAGE
jgi:membrane-bound lytic murein transglycosylase B